VRVSPASTNRMVRGLKGDDAEAGLGGATLADPRDSHAGGCAREALGEPAARRELPQLRDADCRPSSAPPTPTKIASVTAATLGVTVTSDGRRGEDATGDGFPAGGEARERHAASPQLVQNDLGAELCE
jgi:hypothetical protein